MPMLRLKNLLLVLLPFVICNIANGQIITRYAGDYATGYSGDGGPATAASMDQPAGVYSDKAGNIYIADFSNNVVRKVNSSGIISTIAGNGTQGYSGDGNPATAAQLYHPTHVAVDGSGNVYIADAFNNVIRKVNTSGVITTVAGNTSTGYTGDGGPATAAQLEDPNGVWADAAGNFYIADAHNNVIRKVNTSGIITTIIGNGYNAGTTLGGYSGDGGPATAAELFYPESVTMDNAGNFYVAELYNNTIRKVNTAGIITTIAGNNSAGFGYSGDGGPAIVAKLGHPYDAIATSTGVIYIADQTNNVVRSVDAAGIIHTYAGNNSPGSTGDGGPATAASLSIPVSVSVDQYDNLYIADALNNVIRRVNAVPSSVTQQTTMGAELKVFPNPSTGTFTIGQYSGVSEAAGVIITNILGQVVKELTVNTNQPIEISLNARPGIYFISVTGSFGRTMKRIIVE
jgi:trimeric autotransporter adhesin